MRNLWRNSCQLLWEPWRQSDFIINNRAFIGKVIHSEATFRNWISNWQTREIFLISWTISLWCIHYRGTVTLLITQNNVRAIPETLAMHGKLIPLLRVSDVISIQLNGDCNWDPITRHSLLKLLTFSVSLVSHTTIMPPSVALVQSRAYLAAMWNLLEIKGTGRETC